MLKISFAMVLAVVALLSDHAISQPLNLIPYRKGNLWGYSDLNGKVIIEPTFERTYFFNGDSIARFKEKGLYGFLDAKGSVRIKPEFSSATDFYLGISSVEKDNKKYCINLDGQEDECNPVEEQETPEKPDYAPFAVINDSTGLRLFIAASNDTVDDEFDDIRIIERYFFPTTTQYAIVRKGEFFGAYNQMGIQIAPIEFEKIDVLDADSYKAMKDSRWGANDFQGKNLLPFQYDSIEKVTELLLMEERLQKNNHFIVSKKNKFGVVDSSNKPVLKTEYDVIRPPAPCTCPTEYVVGKGGLVGLTDSKGKFVVPMKYAEVQPFQSASITLVKTATGKEGYVSRTGVQYFSE